MSRPVEAQTFGLPTLAVIRPTGPYGRHQLPSGLFVVETSIEAMRGSTWRLGDLEEAHLTAVVLEDLRFDELDDEVKVALLRAGRGHSCPVVTRWTTLAPDDAS